MAYKLWFFWGFLTLLTSPRIRGGIKPLKKTESVRDNFMTPRKAKDIGDVIVNSSLGGSGDEEGNEKSKQQSSPCNSSWHPVGRCLWLRQSRVKRLLAMSYQILTTTVPALRTVFCYKFLCFFSIWLSFFWVFLCRFQVSI